MFREAELPVSIADGCYSLEAVVGSGGMAVVYLATVDLERFDLALLLAYSDRYQGDRSRVRGARRAARLQALRRKPRHELLAELDDRGLSLPPPRCAVKVLGDQLTRKPDALERFQSEWEALIAHDCPRLVRVFGGGVDEQHRIAWYAMEHVDAMLSQDEVQRQPAATKLRVLTDAAEGLIALHQRKLLHRDIKPQNLLVHRDGDTVRAKVADLGIAKSLEQTTGLTRTGAVFGTPHYLAPELLHGAKRSTVASDVYALGATLYALFAGQPPYHGTSELEMMGKLFNREAPEPLGSVAPGTPPAIDALARRMMAFEASDRPASMADVREALEQASASLGSAGAILPTRGADTEAATLPDLRHGAPRAKRSTAPRRRRTRRVQQRSTDGDAAVRPPAWLLVAGGAGVTLLLVAVFLGGALFGRGGEPSSGASSAQASSDQPLSVASGEPTPPAAPPFTELERRLQALPPELALAELDGYLAMRPAAADQARAAERRQRLIGELVEQLLAPLREEVERVEEYQAAGLLLDRLVDPDFERAAPTVRAAARAQLPALRARVAERCPELISYARHDSLRELSEGRTDSARRRLERIERWAIARWADQLATMKRELAQLSDPARQESLKERFERLLNTALAHVALDTRSFSEVNRVWQEMRSDRQLLELCNRADDPRIFEVVSAIGIASGWFKFLGARQRDGRELTLTVHGQPQRGRIVGLDRQGALTLERADGGKLRVSPDDIPWQQQLQLSLPFAPGNRGMIAGVVLVCRGQPALARPYLEQALKSADSGSITRGWLSMRKLQLESLPGRADWLPTDVPLDAQERRDLLRRDRLAARGKLELDGRELDAEAFAQALQQRGAARLTLRPQQLFADELERRLVLGGGEQLVVLQASRLAGRTYDKPGYKLRPLRFYRQRLFVLAEPTGALGGEGRLLHVRGARLHEQGELPADVIDVDVYGTAAAVLTQSGFFVARRGLHGLGPLRQLLERKTPLTQVRWLPPDALFAGVQGLRLVEQPLDLPPERLRLQRLSGGDLSALETARGRAVSVALDGQLTCWRRGDGWTKLAHHKLTGPRPHRLALHPSGLLAAVASADGRVALLDTATAKPIRTLQFPRPAAPEAAPLAFSWRHLYVVSGQKLARFGP